MNTIPQAAFSPREPFTGNPIKSVPDDIRMILEATSQSASDVKTRIIYPKCLSELIKALNEGVVRLFSLTDALSIARRLECRNSNEPCILPVNNGGLTVLLGIYDYPDYRFLDWIHHDVDIRLSAYTCIIPSE